MYRSKYKFRVENWIIIIEDLDGDKSVTNDVENVLEDLVKMGISVQCYQIIYRDTTGIWDEIRTNIKGEFTAFISLNAKTEEEAIKKLLPF